MWNKYIILTTMRSRYLIFSLGIALLGLLVPMSAAAVTPAPESVTNLTITAHLSKSDILDVTESIDYDFGGAKPHNVNHGLPLSYYDDQGNPYPVSFSWQGARLNG